MSISHLKQWYIRLHECTCPNMLWKFSLNGLRLHYLFLWAFTDGRIILSFEFSFRCVTTHFQPEGSHKITNDYILKQIYYQGCFSLFCKTSVILNRQKSQCKEYYMNKWLFNYSTYTLYETSIHVLGLSDRKYNSQIMWCNLGE